MCSGCKDIITPRSPHPGPPFPAPCGLLTAGWPLRPTAFRRLLSYYLAIIAAFLPRLGRREGGSPWIVWHECRSSCMAREQMRDLPPPNHPSRLLLPPLFYSLVSVGVDLLGPAASEPAWVDGPCAASIAFRTRSPTTDSNSVNGTDSEAFAVVSEGTLSSAIAWCPRLCHTVARLLTTDLSVAVTRDRLVFCLWHLYILDHCARRALPHLTLPPRAT